MTKKTRQIIVVAAAAALGGFILAALFWSMNRPQTPRAQGAAAGAQGEPAAVVTSAQKSSPSPPPQQAQQQQPQGAQSPEAIGQEERSFLSEVFGIEDAGTTPRERATAAQSWRVTVPRIILRLALAAALAAMLAFRPRKNSSVIQRNLYVAQTQILLAVVASSLMMVVGDNAARAFGIFAAVSLVRFRTNIRDPKEITVLLISLSLGLATGVGRWELAIILSLFVLPLLWFLEYNEEEQVFRAMELTVRTRDTVHTHGLLQGIFGRHGMNAEVRQIVPPIESEPVGTIMYYVQMSLTVSTDQVNDEIMEAVGHHVESIEWDQQKNTAYVYQ